MCWLRRLMGFDGAHSRDEALAQAEETHREAQATITLAKTVRDLVRKESMREETDLQGRRGGR